MESRPDKAKFLDLPASRNISQNKYNFFINYPLLGYYYVIATENKSSHKTYQEGNAK